MNLLHSLFLLATALAAGLTTSPDLHFRQSCQSGYFLCAPTDATSSTIPDIGPALAPLYPALLDSVSGVRNLEKRAWVELALRNQPTICCRLANVTTGPRAAVTELGWVLMASRC
jgi:hypothetical protein